MSEVAMVGLDLARNMIQASRADSSGRAMSRKKLRRDQASLTYCYSKRGQGKAA